LDIYLLGLNLLFKKLYKDKNNEVKKVKITVKKIIIAAIANPGPAYANI
tara:strand:- start:2788 stop:2934 length:147 start_codon:yes stop_codon:yes gene_type:complete